MEEVNPFEVNHIRDHNRDLNQDKSEKNIEMSSHGKSTRTPGKSLGTKRTRLDTDFLSSHSPKLSKAFSNTWAFAKDKLLKDNEPSSSSVLETSAIASIKSWPAEDGQIVPLLDSGKRTGQSVSLDQPSHAKEKSNISVSANSYGDSQNVIADDSPVTEILSSALVDSTDGHDLVQISKAIGDKMTQMAYLALEGERKMQTTLAIEVSRMKEVNANLLSRLDSRISENLELEKLLKQERERSMSEMEIQKDKHRAETIKCKMDLVKSHLTIARLHKKCDTLKAELDEYVKRENPTQESERLMSLEKELERQKEKYRVDISEYQSQLGKSKKRAAELLKKNTDLEADIPNQEAAAVLAFKTSSEYHKIIEGVFMKAREECRAMLEESFPHIVEGETKAGNGESAVKTEDGSLGHTHGATTA